MAIKATKNIHQRLHAVMQEIGYVQKDKQVGEGRSAYMAVTHDNVVAQVRPHFLKHGISMSVNLISGQNVDTGKLTSSGIKIMRFEGVFAVSFFNIDDPTDVVVEHIPAAGEDTGDKAQGKAVSYAKKYGLLTVLMLETGIDDESRVATQDAPWVDAYLTEIRSANDRASLTGIKNKFLGDSRRDKESQKTISEALSKRAGELQAVPA